jgi:hypothetical protein
MVTGAVPVAVAGTAAEPDDPEEPEEVEESDEGDDEVELFEASRLCIAAVNWVLTRLNAVWLAMLASPLPKLVSAELMAEITESVAACALLSLCC